MCLLANRGKSAGDGKVHRISHRPAGCGEPQPVMTSEFLVMDNRFIGGTYATDKHNGYRQLPRDVRDILKILENEYVCYLCDPQGLQQAGREGSPENITPPEFPEPVRVTEQKTLTEFLLGDDRLIDRLLNGDPPAEWVTGPLFGEDEADLLSSLAPEELLRELPGIK